MNKVIKYGAIGVATLGVIAGIIKLTKLRDTKCVTCCEDMECEDPYNPDCRCDACECVLLEEYLERGLHDI